MKAILSSIFLLVCLVITVSAAAPPNAGREIIELKMGNMILPFKHWKHQNKLNMECYHCHAAVAGKIDNWGKETAHTICIACHDLYENGPVECKQCHKNSKIKK